MANNDILSDKAHLFSTSEIIKDINTGYENVKNEISKQEYLKIQLKNIDILIEDNEKEIENNILKDLKRYISIFLGFIGITSGAAFIKYITDMLSQVDKISAIWIAVYLIIVAFISIAGAVAVRKNFLFSMNDKVRDLKYQRNVIEVLLQEEAD